MKTTLASKGLYLVSIGLAVFAVIRWWFTYPDISQLAFGLTTAFTCAILAYTHSGFRNLSNSQRESDQQIVAIQKVADEARDKEMEGIGRTVDREVNNARETETKLEKHLEQEHAKKPKEE